MCVSVQHPNLYLCIFQSNTCICMCASSSLAPIFPVQYPYLYWCIIESKTHTCMCASSPTPTSPVQHPYLYVCICTCEPSNPTPKSVCAYHPDQQPSLFGRIIHSNTHICMCVQSNTHICTYVSSNPTRPQGCRQHLHSCAFTQSRSACACNIHFQPPGHVCTNAHAPPCCQCVRACPTDAQLLSRNPLTLREANFFLREAIDVSIPDKQDAAAHSASRAMDVGALS